MAGAIGGGASTLVWTTSGDGSFDDATLSTAIYTPGTSDISTGSVTLTLTTDDPDGSGPCLAVSDDLVLTITPVEENTFNIFEGSGNNGNPVSVGQSDVDVGSTTVGLDLDRDFTIENNQASVLSIALIASTDPAFEVLNIPSSIQPGSSEVFTIRLVATEVGVFNSEISITSDFAPFTFSVVGEVTAEQPGAITVYNAVSPNGDGKHDYLEIERIEQYPTNRVVIMNRWGDIVYEAGGYDNSTVRFEGLSNNGSELPPGTYYYQIELGDGTEMQTGFVTLRR
jgi:gliding motility-associated-like protein